MIYKSLRFRVRRGLTACTCLLIVALGNCGAQSAKGSDDSSTGKSFTSSIKEGWDKMTGAVLPAKKPGESEPANDAISLKTQAKAGPELYLALARMYERSGKTAEAERQYQMALNEDPNNLPVLLGYAQLKENDGKPEEAIKWYQQAAKTHPNDAAVFNNLGLYYAHRGAADDAITALGKAIQLQPKNVLYRNNIATILVEKGQTEQAFSHLRAVHGDAIAYYNLGYLLNKKGRKREAIQHFQLALDRDPTLNPARTWLAWLQNGSAPVGTQPAVPPNQASPLRDRLDSLRVASDPPTLPSATVAPKAPTPTAPPTFSPAPTVVTTPPVGRQSATSGVLPRPTQAARLSQGNDANAQQGTSRDLPPMPPDLSPPKRLPPTTGVATSADADGLSDQSAAASSGSAAPTGSPILKSAIRVLPRDPR